MPDSVNFRGQSFFHDEDTDQHLANKLCIVVDLERTVLLIGTPGERDMEEITFHHPEIRRAFQAWAGAMRRRAYRRRPIRPVPKPISDTCELCHGRRTIRNPYSGEVFTCPACHE